MSNIIWSSSQREAIGCRGKGILVSAAAGSGKTAVLVQRIIERICDTDNPCQIDDLLVVTFTRAAADEMREKIQTAIFELIYNNPDNMFFQHQAALLSGAKITTVHGFCSDLVKENFQYLDISPNFRMGDEGELTLLKSELLDELLENAFNSPNGMDGLIQLADMLTTHRSDEGLKNSVLQVFEKLQSIPNPQKWLNEKVQMYKISQNEPLEKTEWGRIILENFILNLNYLIELLKNSLYMIKDCEPLYSSYGVTLNEDILLLSNALKAAEIGSYDGIVDCVKCSNFTILKRVKKSEDIGFENDKQRIKYIRDFVKKTYKNMCLKYFCIKSSEWIEDIKKLNPAVSCLFKLVSQFSEGFAKAKAQRNILDFNDLEHFALKLLIDEKGEAAPLANRIRNRFTEILVDEYQDTNETQDLIFSSISKDGKNIFMVGDVKQSIYRFREADPTIFIKKYKSFSKCNEYGKNKKIILSKNYRSRQGIIDIVNMFFSDIMSEKLGELDYGEDEQLNFGGLYPNDLESHTPEMIVVETQDTEDDEENDEIGFSSIEYEAIAAAKKINELIEQDFLVYDTKRKTHRPVCFKDIAVLMRSVKGRAEVYSRVFADFGIPSYSEAGDSFFKTTEIAVMLSLLKVIDNPHQDIPLIAVMRSPIFGFNEDELLSLRLTCKKEDLYTAVLKCTDTSEKLKSFTDKISGYRTKSVELSIDRLLWYLYEDTGYYTIVRAMKNSEVRQANLRLLFEYARKFEETSFKGLFNFINYINKLMEQKGDLQAAKLAAEQSDSVRIMSMHKSKGLEFPVCIISGIGKNFNLKDIENPVLLHSRLGIGTKVKDLDKRITYPSIAKESLAIIKRRDMLSEEVRVLYVAMTRAKEKLIILGSCRDFNKLSEGIAYKSVCGKKPSPAWLLQCNSYLEWIISSLNGKLLFDNNSKAQNKSNILHCDRIKLKTAVLPKQELVNWAANQSNDSLNTLQDTNKSDCEFDEEIYSVISKRLSFIYPYETNKKIPAKISVTELKNYNLIEDNVPILNERNLYKYPVPGFLKKEQALTPAQKGTAAHKVMQFIDFSKTDRREKIQDEIFRLIEEGYITEEEGDSVSAEKLFKFFESNLAKRMKLSKRVYREERFNLLCNDYELFNGLENSNDTVVLQGVIDCFFEESDGSIVLLDFKTDYINTENEIKLVNEYGIQLKLYKKAIEEIYNKRVAEGYLYFLTAEREVKIF